MPLLQLSIRSAPGGKWGMCAPMSLDRGVPRFLYPLTVDRVDPGTPAHLGGIQVGDSVMEIDGRSVRGHKEFGGKAVFVDDVSQRRLQSGGDCVLGVQRASAALGANCFFCGKHEVVCAEGGEMVCGSCGGVQGPAMMWSVREVATEDHVPPPLMVPKKLLVCMDTLAAFLEVPSCVTIQSKNICSRFCEAKKGKIKVGDDARDILAAACLLTALRCNGYPTTEQYILGFCSGAEFRGNRKLTSFMKKLQRHALDETGNSPVPPTVEDLIQRFCNGLEYRFHGKVDYATREAMYVFARYFPWPGCPLFTMCPHGTRAIDHVSAGSWSGSTYVNREWRRARRPPW